MSAEWEQLAEDVRLVGAFIAENDKELAGTSGFYDPSARTAELKVADVADFVKVCKELCALLANLI